MGKIRRQRNKFHISNPQIAPPESTTSWNESTNDVDNFNPQSFENIFAGINIPLNTVNLRDDDTRTVISTSKSAFKDKGMNKEDRRKLRHITFIERINAIQTLKKMKQKKKKTSQVNEVPGTSSAAASISFLQESETKPWRMPMKKRSRLKARGRQNRMMKDIAALQEIWENPAFKADPAGLISEMIQEKITKENE